MANCSMQIEIRGGEVEAILSRLTEAQKEIYKCYAELEELGVLVIKEEADSGN